MAEVVQVILGIPPTFVNCSRFVNLIFKSIIYVTPYFIHWINIVHVFRPFQKSNCWMLSPPCLCHIRKSSYTFRILKKSHYLYRTFNKDQGVEGPYLHENQVLVFLPHSQNKIIKNWLILNVFKRSNENSQPTLIKTRYCTPHFKRTTLLNPVKTRRSHSKLWFFFDQASRRAFVSVSVFNLVVKTYIFRLDRK